MIDLSDVTDVQRVDVKPYCIELEVKGKAVLLAFKSDEEVYGWMDDLSASSPALGVSNPTNFVHQVHVGFDPISGAFTVSDIDKITSRAYVSGLAGTMDKIVDLFGNH